jgi:DNA-binding GntR family transcriptional regulator
MTRTRRGTAQGAREPAKEAAYRYVRSEIVARAASEPYFLAEEVIAAALDMSRTPVREAFLRLEAEGFLTLVPRKGALVRPITEREIVEVMEVRLLIERSAAEKAVASDEQRAQLVERLAALDAELRELAEGADVSAFIECDRRFHEEVVIAANNSTLLDLYHRLRDRQLGMGLHAVLDNKDRISAVCDEHGRIIESFERGDPAAISDAITGHLDATAQVLRQRLAGR